MPNADFPNSVTFKAAEEGQSRMVFDNGLTVNAVVTPGPALQLTTGVDSLATGTVTSAALLALSGKTSMTNFALEATNVAAGITISDGTRTITVPMGGRVDFVAAQNQILGLFSITLGAGDTAAATWQCY